MTRQCVNEDHYPFPEPPTELTADPRLHNYDTGTPCEYAGEAASYNPALHTADGSPCVPASPVRSETRFYETSPYTGGPRLVRSRKLYRTIVVDPPWDYSDTTFREGSGHGEKYANRSLPYASMTLDAIRSLPIAEWADDDAALFLWTTSRYLPDSFGVVEAWGFRYVQMLVWGKPGPMPLAMPFAPPASEFLLACKRGSPPRRGKFPSSVIIANQGKHSEKPDVFMDHIEVVGWPPYLDVFARRHRMGWDCWGNEVYNEPELLETLDEGQRAGLVAKGGS